jgi:hypothetical protein
MFEIKKQILILLILITLLLLKYSIMRQISNYFIRKNKKRIMKKITLTKIYKITRKDINKINTLFIKGKPRCGNFFISINNAIIYCEILDCKKIIIENNNKIYINNTIIDKKNNFTIEPNQAFNSRDKYSLILYTYFYLFHGFRMFININRLSIFREQLLNNLPKVVAHPNDLYIYIRSGDIFVLTNRGSINGYYQPPLCFYVKILDQFSFRKVYIISVDKLNFVIPALLDKYSYIKNRKNILKVDISYLINSYNIVAAKSTLFSASIKINDKLKFLWEYDIYSSLRRTYLSFHYSFYKFPLYYTIYKMNSSIKYKRIMKPWTNSPKQRKMMLNEKCLNNFDIIKQ